MLAVNFQNIGETTTISIQDLIPGTTAGLKGYSNATQADVIMVYDSSTSEYTTYFLYVNPRNANDAKNGKWCVSVNGAPVATNTFVNGDSFWFKKYAEGDATIRVSGGVSVAAGQTLTIEHGYNMFGSAFPANFNPNNIGVDWKEAIANGASGYSNATQADVIMVYDAATEQYTTYFLYNNPRNANDAKNGKWCLSANGAPAVDATAEVIASGKGAWYKHYGNTTFNITAKSPLK